MCVGKTFCIILLHCVNTNNNNYYYNIKIILHQASMQNIDCGNDRAHHQFQCTIIVTHIL